jgi:hypothetical protein
MPHHSYVVTAAADTTTRGTLRSAILFANAHPGTTITFAAKLAHHTITLMHELPLILGNHTVIDGSGAPHLTISGDNQFRVFFIGDTVHTVSATIENLTISHALAIGGNGGSGGVAGGGGAGLGGAIFVSDHASLAVGGLVLANDAAVGGNGGTATGAGHGGGGGMGATAATERSTQAVVAGLVRAPTAGSVPPPAATAIPASSPGGQPGEAERVAAWEAPMAAAVRARARAVAAVVSMAKTA